MSYLLESCEPMIVIFPSSVQTYTINERVFIDKANLNLFTIGSGSTTPESKRNEANRT